MKIRCRTLFDITATGVTGHHKPSQIPFMDRGGNAITNQDSWNRARNQQRNWETLTQLMQLRAQINELSTPVLTDGQWQFEFEVENSEVFRVGTDPVGALLSDCADVPMITRLTETEELPHHLVTQGASPNTRFDVV